MVAMVTKQKIFDKLYLLYEPFKDEPIPHKNFKSLLQESSEMAGGLTPPPPLSPVSDVVLKPLVSEGLKETGVIQIWFSYLP